MPLRLRILSLAAPLLLVAAFPCAAPAAAARAVTFVFSGVVVVPGGEPDRGAKVLLQGLARPAATTDAEGRYSFSHVVPDVEALAAAPLRLVLRASHKGWNLALPSGASALAVELRFVRATDGGARLEVRSNDAGVAGSVAASFGVPGDVTVALSGAFMRQMGAEDRSEPVLRALEIVPLAPPPPATGVATAAPGARADTMGVAPASGAQSAPSWSTRPDSATSVPPAAVPLPAPSRPERPESMRLFPSAPDPGTARSPGPAAPVSPEPADSLRIQVTAKAGIVEGSEPMPRRGPGGRRFALDTAATSLPGIRVSVRPDTTALAPASAGPGGGSALRVALGRALPDTQPSARAGGPCECHVKGTVEVVSDRPLPVVLRVAVWLADVPAARDTVTLYMGPPRPFDLGRVPCGSHRLEVMPLTSRRYTRSAPPPGEFDCRADVTRPIRVVLERR